MGVLSEQPLNSGHPQRQHDEKCDLKWIVLETRIHHIQGVPHRVQMCHRALRIWSELGWRAVRSRLPHSPYLPSDYRMEISRL